MSDNKRPPAATEGRATDIDAGGVYSSASSIPRVAHTCQCLTELAQLWDVDPRAMIDAFREAAERELERQRIAADAALRALDRGASDD